MHFVRGKKGGAVISRPQAMMWTSAVMPAAMPAQNSQKFAIAPIVTPLAFAPNCRSSA